MSARDAVTYEQSQLETVGEQIRNDWLALRVPISIRRAKKCGGVMVDRLRSSNICWSLYPLSGVDCFVKSSSLGEEDERSGTELGGAGSDGRTRTNHTSEAMRWMLSGECWSRVWREDQRRIWFSPCCLLSTSTNPRLTVLASSLPLGTAVLPLAPIALPSLLSISCPACSCLSSIYRGGKSRSLSGPRVSCCR